LPELYQLGSLAFSKGLSFWVIPAEIEEFRYLNGWSKDGKKGSSRCDRIPLSFGPTVKIETPADCRALLPDLGDPFTQKEFAKAAKLSPRKACMPCSFYRPMIFSFVPKERTGLFIYRKIKACYPHGSLKYGPISATQKTKIKKPALILKDRLLACGTTLLGAKRARSKPLTRGNVAAYSA
jgi:hypothetical protein